MTKRKADLETHAQQKQEVRIPDELMEAYMLDRMKWSYADLRSTPNHVISELRLLWHLENVAKESADRAAKPKTKRG